MAEITTASATPAAAPPPATTAPDIPPVAVSVLQKVENVVFAFLQAHYGKGVAAVVGFLLSNFGVIGKLWGFL
jgi:hypothetical protein